MPATTPAKGGFHFARCESDEIYRAPPPRINRTSLVSLVIELHENAEGAAAPVTFCRDQLGPGVIRNMMNDLLLPNRPPGPGGLLLNSVLKRRILEAAANYTLETEWLRYSARRITFAARPNEIIVPTNADGERRERTNELQPR